MPDTSPTLGLLQKLGLSIPDMMNTAEQSIRDKNVQAQQANDPFWKRLVRGGIDAAANIPKGLLGIDPSENESNAGYLSNVLTQLGGAAGEVAKAGLPFLAATGGKPVYHGAKRAFETFDPSRYDKSDTMGYMTHFALDPGYAEQFATGNAKSFGLADFKPEESIRPNIIPAEVKAKNILDLTNPNPDDIAQFIASQKPETRDALVRVYKTYNKLNRYDSLGQKSPTKAITSDLMDIMANPGKLERTPFDAVKYTDVNAPALAVPEQTPIQSFYGKAPLNDAPRELNILRSEYGSGGQLTPTNNWKPNPTGRARAIPPENY